MHRGGNVCVLLALWPSVPLWIPLSLSHSQMILNRIFLRLLLTKINMMIMSYLPNSEPLQWSERVDSWCAVCLWETPTLSCLIDWIYLVSLHCNILYMFNLAAWERNSTSYKCNTGQIHPVQTELNNITLGTCFYLPDQCDKYNIGII